MNNNSELTWTVSETPPERAHRKPTSYQKWGEVFGKIVDSNPGQWVELDAEFSQSEAQSVYLAGRRHSESDFFGKIEVKMRTAQVLRETFRDGTPKRTYSLFIRVEKKI